MSFVVAQMCLDEANVLISGPRNWSPGPEGASGETDADTNPLASFAHKELNSMKRFLIAGIAGVSTFGAVFGFAAAVEVVSDDFGAGSDSVVACDLNGVTASYTTSYSNGDQEYEVTAVKIEGINTTTCNGQTVGVTLSGLNTATATPLDDTIRIGDGSAVINAESMSVTIGETPAAADVTGVDVVLRTTLNSSSNES